MPRPPSLPRAAARPTRPTIPRAPRPRIRPTARARPCAHCTSITYALLPAARVPLYRHRADPESSSRSLPSGSPARIVPTAPTARIAPTARRRPHRAHRAPTSASPPPSLSLRCGGPRALTGKNRAVCIPFSPNARKRPPSWQHPPEMHAFRDQDGNILALCIHFRAQSGDSGYMARESCRQGPSFASRNPKSRMTRRCCQRRAAFPRQRPAVRPNGLCAMRQRHATRGMAERALRPAARAWPACCMRPPAISLVPAAACAPCHLACARRRPRSSPPSYTRCASPPASRPRTPPSAAPPIAVGMSCRSGSSCRPRAAHADASRPSMRARRHRLGPDPREPSPSPEPTESRPRANRASPTRGDICAHPRPATRCISPCRVGPATVPVIPAKWCGDTITHTRKLRF